MDIKTQTTDTDLTEGTSDRYIFLRAKEPGSGCVVCYFTKVKTYRLSILLLFSHVKIKRE